MGIDSYALRNRLSGDLVGQSQETVTEAVLPDPPAPPRPAQPEPVVPVSTVDDKSDALDWQQLKTRVERCSECELCHSRTRTVFGAGDENADLLIIGEAPGAEEDRQGLPFVGPAGVLLDAMLHAMGLQREQVYIANIVKCRPPGNRNPGKPEAAACRQHLEHQIALIQPKVILSVGAVSAHNLLHNEESVGRLRLRLHQYGNQQIPLLVTYHPAYLLRSPAEKAKVWQDLQKLMQLMR